MEKKMQLASWLIYIGIFMFFLVGLVAAVYNESFAAYYYQAVYEKSFDTVTAESREFMSSTVRLTGLFSISNAICFSMLCWIAFSQRNRWIFLIGLIGGSIGVAGFLPILMAQKAWTLFIVMNICLQAVAIGFLVGGKEFRDFLLGRDSEDQKEEEKDDKKVIIGALGILLGGAGLYIWFQPLLQLLAAAVSLTLVIGGCVVLYLGINEVKDIWKNREAAN